MAGAATEQTQHTRPLCVSPIPAARPECRSRNNCNAATERNAKQPEVSLRPRQPSRAVWPLPENTSGGQPRRSVRWQRSPAQTGRPVEAGRQSRHDTAAYRTSTVRPQGLSDTTWPTHATIRFRRHADNKPAFISVQCRGAVAKPATSAHRETQAVRGRSPTHRLACRGKADACTTLRASHARPQPAARAIRRERRRNTDAERSTDSGRKGGPEKPPAWTRQK